MAGSIFILDENDKLIELKQSKSDSEDIFQELIEKFPNILAGDQISPDNPRRWIFIGREVGVPSEANGGNQWFLDHLFIDQDAIPTFVEVKRSTDTRIRREVVAQMLDYAANATEYWPIEIIRESYEKLGSNLYEELGIDEQNEELFWSNVSTNLKSGKIRLMFVADEIPMSLRRIIEFLNGQMTDTEVLGLEIKQFISEFNIKTLVPILIGQTSEAIQVKNQSKGQWDKDSFLQEVERASGEEAVAICEKLINSLEDIGCRIWWGRGKKYASFVAMYDGKQKYQLLSIYPYESVTRFELYFQHYATKEPFISIEIRKKLQNKFNQINGIHVPDNKLDKRPSFDLSVLKDENNMELFIDVFKFFIEEVKKYEEIS